MEDVGAVIRSAVLTSDPTDPSRATTLGYGVDRRDYPRSAATVWQLRLADRRQAVCAVELRLRLYVVRSGAPSGSVLVERTVALPGAGSQATVPVLVADVPDGDSTGSGPCVAADVVLSDALGTVLQTAPTTGPLVICPGSGGEVTLGG